ncbi:NfeD-like C-terminal, partner-binding [Evansella caseinilytica]|uniref:NfeD-like C-terminal, partner-binding n=1 Tax=Evansella caseinilytica TaxID=1503961 RepID=A0A1H3KMW9_9BACI|nr:NfeD family protein [Evansella caseinilytica]SDY53389.1 NfeD-like C-terminal, partner-binding [Evansella caseinilytica]
MEVLDNASLGFLVIFIATLFIFGELMVKAKGIFAVIGIVIMTMYFSYHLTATASIWVILLYIVGLLLIIFDGKVTTDGTIALIGLLMMILGLALPAPSIMYGVLVAMALIVAAPTSYLFTKVFPPRNMWSKMTLKERLTGDLGYNSMNADYKDLVGKTGVTKTSFRPTGTVEIEGKLYSATTDNQWMDTEQKVKVISVDGTRIVVVPEV